MNWFYCDVAYSTSHSAQPLAGHCKVHCEVQLGIKTSGKQKWGK